METMAGTAPSRTRQRGRRGGASVGDAERLVRALRPRLEARGGSLVVERAWPEVKAALDVWGDPGPAFALMRGVKAAFDPAGILAPGRFVGGL
jgi:glycolate oxidase FAD binding subunit